MFPGESYIWSFVRIGGQKDRTLYSTPWASNRQGMCSLFRGFVVRGTGITAPNEVEKSSVTSPSRGEFAQSQARCPGTSQA